MGLKNPQPGPWAIFTNGKSPPLDLGFREDVKHVLSSECITNPCDDSDRSHQEDKPCGTDEFRKAPKGECTGSPGSSLTPRRQANEAKEAVKHFVLSKSVARKRAQTFIDLEVMQTSIMQFIRKEVDDYITDAVDKRTATMFTKEMRIDEKWTDYPEGNSEGEPPLDIVFQEDDSSCSYRDE